MDEKLIFFKLSAVFKFVDSVAVFTKNRNVQWMKR